MKNKILITGGAGFIGSNLCEYFLSKEYQVICMDNFSTGHKHNIAPFLTNENFKLIEADIRNLNDCHQACQGVDYVLHQAALGSVPRSIQDPITTNEVNVTGFLNILASAKESKVKRLIFASSSSTYGNSTFIPKEENIIGNPLSPYAVTKFVNELYADVFYRCYGLNYIGLRYFNVFGPNQDPNSSYSAVIPKFCLNILKGDNILINGNGLISRDFTFVDNIVQANVLSIFSDKVDSLNQIYNVGCGEMFSIKYLAEELIKISEKSIKIINGPVRIGDIEFSKASIDKINKSLGYTPLIHFDEGLKRTWEFYKSKYLNSNHE
jgi:UDP-N-acetylglucosamine 4-epimerase